jgi:hypothetical protein
MYWTGVPGIGRANLDGSDANPSFITLGGGTGEVVLTVDGQHIYWSIPMPQPRSSC